MRKFSPAKDAQVGLHWCSLATATSRHKLLSAVSISRLAVLCYLFFYLQPFPYPLTSTACGYQVKILPAAIPAHWKHLISKGKRPWGEWSIQGCASQSWIPRQGRCRTSAGRRHPASNIIPSLNRASYQWRSWRELKVRGAICLPVEGNLVDYWDLKAGDLRLAVLLAEPNIKQRETASSKRAWTTCKEVFGQSGQRLLGCGNLCWVWFGWLRTDPPPKRHCRQPEILGLI